MRVTTLQTTNTMLDYVTSSQAKYYELAEESASGVKVSEPSDDPIATKSIMNANVKLSELDGYLNNMKTTQSELNTADSVLDSLTDSIQNASDYATQAANGTYNENDLKTIKSQIDSIIDSVVDVANTSFNGKYIFSGTATSTESYAVDSTTGSITYNGNNSSRTTTISDGVSVVINANGEDVFGSYTVGAATITSSGTGTEGSVVTFGTDIDGNTTITTATTVYNSTTSEYDTTTTVGTAKGLLGDLTVLSTALGTGDTATINSCITGLDNDLDTTTAARTKLAAVSNRFEMTTTSINQSITNLKSYKSNLEDADLAEVLTELALAESAMEASYSVTAQMLGATSLLDYL